MVRPISVFLRKDSRIPCLLDPMYRPIGALYIYDSSIFEACRVPLTDLNGGPPKQRRCEPGLNRYLLSSV